MLASSRPAALTVTPAPHDDASPTTPSDLGSPSVHFPHTRAQLLALARRFKPFSLAAGDDAGDVDDLNRVSSALVNKVVELLDTEEDEQLRVLLMDTFGRMNDDETEQHVLDLMHSRRDDADNRPFLQITTPRRPISRPSSRASSHSVRLAPGRPETPVSAPSSPLGLGFRRPHTPIVSPLATSQSSSYMNVVVSESPTASPTLAHAHATQAHAQFAASLPASPLSSPRLLNAKASEFKPVPRPLSRAASNPSSLSALRTQTPSPDLWAHRATSNLAIAAPLIPESMLLSRVPTPSSSLRASLRPEGDDDDDPFDPFTATKSSAALQSDPADLPDFDAQWSVSSNSNSSLSADDHGLRSPGAQELPAGHASAQETEGDDADAAALLTDGMTPFDVLSSVFGATLAPSELEDALAANGYDFERAMAWIINERVLPSPPAKSPASPQYAGNRVTIVSRGGPNGVVRGGRGDYVQAGFAAGRAASPRFANGRPSPGGNRVCRYFLAGECLRADCRFSHDLERALCRFWLRGTCAKGETCEFLHHLPKDVDVSRLTSAMSHTDLGSATVRASTPPDEFPALGAADNSRGSAAHGQYDPSRTRFAAAVKKAATTTPAIAIKPNDSATLLARRQAMGTAADSLHHVTAIVAPRPSPRIKLRPPSLLPTLPTGGVLNNLYLNYRQRALQLGAARNACLSRAADAWRRGDGAAAKRFSREGHDLNAKMKSEMALSARNLVKERTKVVEQAVKARDLGWSDDPADRSARGRSCGAGLGVTLGVASKHAGVDKGGVSATPEERTEGLLDLHGLHANEAIVVLEEFLPALEREHFYGLAYLLVGEEKHTGTQDPGRGASRVRLATGVRETLHHWGYPWSERDGVICVDPLTHE